MNKSRKNFEKKLRRMSARVRYAQKSRIRRKKWLRNKRLEKLHTKKVTKNEKIRKSIQSAKSYKTFTAPADFSLVSNTNEVLKYFSDVEKATRKGNNIIFDIKDVTSLTPDAIAFLVACIKDQDFTHGVLYKGNAPSDPGLEKMFTASGFYDHVIAPGNFKQGKENLLHRETHIKVKSDVAKNAALIGINHVFRGKRIFEPLYEILIESMSNTNNHASPEEDVNCKWSLLVYSDPKKRMTSYSFLDLGIGIFESAVVKDYIRNIFKGTLLYSNLNLVDKLLSGELQSRIDKDREIRGKGIPQIVDSASSVHFQRFYIISNDVKIDLKTRKAELLKNNFKGTFLYWELVN